MTALLWLLRILAIYIAAWFVSYVLYVGFNFQFLAEYWVLFWQGGGETPTFIQLTSWLLTLAAVGIWLGVRFFRRRQGFAAKNAAQRNKSGY